MTAIQFNEKAYSQLTPNEIQVIKFAAEGKTSKEIAADCNLSSRTIEKHKEHALAKLECKSTAQAVAILIRGGII